MKCASPGNVTIQLSCSNTTMVLSPFCIIFTSYDIIISFGIDLTGLLVVFAGAALPYL